MKNYRSARHRNSGRGAQYNNAPLPPSDGPTHGNRACFWCTETASQGGRYVNGRVGLGAMLAKRRIELVFGGLNVGMMGIVADATLEHDGEVFGVVPESFLVNDLAHRGLTAIEVVSSMHERKARMNARADAFIALPGGFSTRVAGGSSARGGGDAYKGNQSAVSAAQAAWPQQVRWIRSEALPRPARAAALEPRGRRVLQGQLPACTRNRRLDSLSRMKTTRASKAAKTNAPPDPQTLALADPSSLQDPTQDYDASKDRLALRGLIARRGQPDAEHRAAYDELISDADRSALGARTRAAGVLRDAVAWGVQIDQDLSAYPALVKSHYAETRFAYFLERTLMLDAVTAQQARRGDQGTTRTTAEEREITAREARKTLIAKLRGVAGRRDAEGKALADAMGRTESADALGSSIQRLITLGTEWLARPEASAKIHCASAGLRGWPLFGHPLSSFGVGAPKPGVKVPEFTSGTGRGQTGKPTAEDTPAAPAASSAGAPAT